MAKYMFVSFILLQEKYWDIISFVWSQINYSFLTTTRDVPHSLQLSWSLHPAPEYDPNIAQTCNVMKGGTPILPELCVEGRNIKNSSIWMFSTYIRPYSILDLLPLTLIKAFQIKLSFKLKSVFQHRMNWILKSPWTGLRLN